MAGVRDRERGFDHDRGRGRCGKRIGLERAQCNVVTQGQHARDVSCGLIYDHDGHGFVFAALRGIDMQLGRIRAAR